MNSNKKITIAYLLRGIEGSVALNLLDGIREAAKKYDINLISLLGNKLSGDKGNVIYSLIDKNNVDGIITWASSDNDEYVKYYNNYAGIPLASLTLPLAGHPVIAIDSYSGMKDAVKHLIQDHGYKKIAFIRGPEHHIYANERYKAYLDALLESNIEFNEDLVTPCGDFTFENGITGFKNLFIEKRLKPGIDINAVVTVTDMIIIAVLQELKKINVKIPEQIALVGFNNTDQAISSSPAVTSVSMPFFEQAVKSVELLLEMIEKKTKPQDVNLPTKLEIYQSCGCQYSNVTKAAIRDNIKNIDANVLNYVKSKVNKKILKSKITEIPVEKLIIENKNFITEIIEKNAGNIRIEKNKIDDMVSVFLDSFFDEISSNKNNVFIKALNNNLFSTMENNGEIDSWHEAVTILRESIAPYLTNYSTRLIASDLIDQARVLISEVTKQKFIKKTVFSEARIDMLRDIGAKLSSIFSITELKDILQKKMKGLNSNGFYLILYEDAQPYKYPEPAPAFSKLIFAYNNIDGLVKIDDSGVKFESKEILPKEIFSKLNRINFLIMPLFFQKTQLGYLIIDNGVLDKNIYPLLRDQIASSLYSIKLFNELEDTKLILENTLKNLRNKAAIISDNSQKISNRVNDISSAMEESAANIREISININQVMSIVNKAVGMGIKINNIINELNDHSKEIGKITGFISEVAQQTNVLSLNASIEAVRAGESGKGFSIVAREVKTLSKSTVKSTEEISKMIKMIQSSTGSTVENITEVVAIIEDISNLSQVITSAINQQSTTINSISNLLVETAAGTKEIADAITEVAEISK